MGGQLLRRQPGRGSGYALSRRNVFKGVAGAAAVGVAGALLVDDASPALAAQDAVSQPSGLAPTVVELTDAATIAVDASAGNDFRVTITGNRTMGVPASPGNGQQVIFQVTQGSGGPFTLAWADCYEFADNQAPPSLSTTAGQTDIFAFIYNSVKGTWLLAGFVTGFD